MLHGNCSLLSLHLRGNYLSSDTGDAVWSSLLLNHTLREIHLERNPGLDAARLREIAVMVETAGCSRVLMVVATTQLQMAYRRQVAVRVLQEKRRERERLHAESAIKVQATARQRSAKLRVAGVRKRRGKDEAAKAIQGRARMRQAKGHVEQARRKKAATALQARGRGVMTRGKLERAPRKIQTQWRRKKAADRVHGMRQERGARLIQLQHRKGAVRKRVKQRVE
jgi:hypothetical protein